MQTIVIDRSQPITGTHVDMFIRLNDLHGQPKKTLLGISDQFYNKMMSDTALPIDSPPLAIMIRYLFENPGKFPLPKVNLLGLYESLLKIDSCMNKKVFSAMLGRHQLSFNRWSKDDDDSTAGLTKEQIKERLKAGKLKLSDTRTITEKKQKMRMPARMLAAMFEKEVNAGNYAFMKSLIEGESIARNGYSIFDRADDPVWVKHDKIPADSNCIKIRDVDMLRLGKDLNFRIMSTYIGLSKNDLELLRQYINASNPESEHFDSEQAIALGDTPIIDTSTALLVKYFINKPDSIPLPASYEVEELLNITGCAQKEIGMYLGRDTFSGHRWKGSGSVNEMGLRQSMSWQVQLLCHYFVEEVRAGRKKEWHDMVMNEGKLFGVDNIFETGSWNRNKRSDSDTETED